MGQKGIFLIQPIEHLNKKVMKTVAKFFKGILLWSKNKSNKITNILLWIFFVGVSIFISRMFLENTKVLTEIKVFLISKDINPSVLWRFIYQKTFTILVVIIPFIIIFAHERAKLKKETMIT